MSDTQSTGDAFKDRLVEAGVTTGRPELAHQSLGRTLRDAETAMAAALLEIYAQNTFDPVAVAAALQERGIVAPGSGSTEWSPELLKQELTAINKSLDDAYQANGYGA